MNSVICGGIWTGMGDVVLPSSRIEISGGKITGISPYPDSESVLFVIPAFVDAHCHFLWTGLESLFINLECAGSSDDLLSIISCEVKKENTGRILRGVRFDESIWPDPELPSLEELDRVTGDRPVFLRRVCGHKAFVNTAMLRMLPFNSQGVDWSSGTIHEGIVFKFESMFQPEPYILEKACSRATELSYSCGVTAISTFETFFMTEALGRYNPPVRLSVYVFGEDADDLEKALNDSSVNLPEIRGLKFFLDGSLGARTAAVSGTYLDGTVVNPLMNDEQVFNCLELSDGLGLTPAFHAIGAKALAQIDRVSRRYLNSGSHHCISGIRVEHAEELIPAWPGSWNPSVHSFIMQPNFVKRWQCSDGLYEARLGRERALSLNPFGLVSRKGFSLGFGSDGMPFGPLRGLRGATDHPVAEYRLDTDAALYAYTLGAASISGFHDLSVHLGEGRSADMTVLSDNPFTAGWDSITVVATIDGGELVYGSEEILEDK